MLINLAHHLKMAVHKITIQYESLQHHEIDPTLKEVFEVATAQLEHSYAPYSDFNVGAAVLLENGAICSGCNQENAAYPLCLCGERVALFHAGTRYTGVPIKALAIICRNNKTPLTAPASPCGACRQVISEFVDRQKSAFPIYLLADGVDFIYKFSGIDSLLPLSFSGESL